MPTTPHSPWSYIESEIQERGWSVRDLAERMGGDADFNHCALDFLATEDPRIKLSERIAAGISAAFGTSAELWLNIDEQYRKEA